jgi:hypothetical protein
MKIKLLKGQLIDVMPENVVRTNWEITIRAKVITQIEDKSDQTLTFFEVLDEQAWDASMKGIPQIELSSIEEVNTYITENNSDVYVKDNEFLMSANLTNLVNSGVIKFEEMKVDWTEQEELAYLYGKGCSGITKNKRYQLLSTE